MRSEWIDYTEGIHFDALSAILDGNGDTGMRGLRVGSRVIYRGASWDRRRAARDFWITNIMPANWNQRPPSGLLLRGGLEC